MEENLLLVPAEEMPQTDEAKKKMKISVNELQTNLLKLMKRDKVELAVIQRETSIPWGTIYSWFKSDVNAQLLDINIKELADFFDVSVDFLAFSVKKYKFDTFDRMELFELKDKDKEE